MLGSKVQGREAELGPITLVKHYSRMTTIAIAKLIKKQAKGGKSKGKKNNQTPVHMMLISIYNTGYQFHSNLLQSTPV